MCQLTLKINLKAPTKSFRINTATWHKVCWHSSENAQSWDHSLRTSPATKKSRQNKHTPKKNRPKGNRYRKKKATKSQPTIMLPSLPCKWMLGMKYMTGWCTTQIYSVFSSPKNWGQLSPNLTIIFFKSGWFNRHLDDTHPHPIFQVPKLEVLNLIRLFWGWIFPYISLTYSLYRWVPPF